MYFTRKRKGIQLAYPFEVRRLKKWPTPYIVQPKLDGERCRAIVKGDSIVLLSSEENEIKSVPHVVDSIRRFVQKLNIDEIELDGELYSHGMSFEEIHSRVGRTKNLHERFFDINYNIFDIVDIDPQVVRTLHLEEMGEEIESQEFLKVVPYDLADNLEEVMDSYEAFLKDGYEGMIVRHFGAPYLRKRSIYMMKFKPKKSDFYQIVGIKEEIDKNGTPKDRLGAFICTSDEGTTFSVGTGLTDEDRIKWWSDAVIGYWLKVEYQHTTPGRKVPRFPVFVEVCDSHLNPIDEIP